MPARTELIELLGGHCAECGASDLGFLQIDHINDDGADDRKKFGPSIYLYYLKRPEEAKDKLQVLCANHNWKKRLAAAKNAPTKPSTLEVSLQEPVYFDKEPLEIGDSSFAVWKGDRERLPPARLRCVNGCDYTTWEMLGDQNDKQKLYLRCIHCGWDVKIWVDLKGREKDCLG